ncbi:MAG: DUF4252 domain-containing protein, partial [Bacteroidota bacterium]|nr:DUF4252 domain-containing protein [Bacteroidota bacterium]
KRLTTLIIDKMKKTMLLVAVLFIVAASQAQTLQGLFEKYSDDEHFEYVSVGNGMMNMASSMGGIAKSNNGAKSKMKSTKILTLKAPSDSQIMKTFEKELNQVLAAGKFETAVETREKGESVHIYYRVSGKDNLDQLIVSKTKKELSLIWNSGKMTKEEMMNGFSSKGDMTPSEGENS